VPSWSTLEKSVNCPANTIPISGGVEMLGQTPDPLSIPNDRGNMDVESSFPTSTGWTGRGVLVDAFPDNAYADFPPNITGYVFEMEVYAVCSS
jgi:hypothetical protein